MSIIRYSSELAGMMYVLIVEYSPLVYQLVLQGGIGMPTTDLLCNAISVLNIAERMQKSSIT